MDAQESNWQRWIAAELRFARCGYRGVGELNSLATGGSHEAKILLTAPHAVAQIRAGNPKLAERGTGGLALSLAAASGIRALCAIGPQSGDPAWDEDSYFKRIVRELSPVPRLIIDLHGMRDIHGPDVDVGTGLHPDDVVAQASRGLAEAISAEGLDVGVNKVFLGDRPETLTSWAQRRGIPAIQVEIAARRRPPTGSRESSMRLYCAFRRFLQSRSSFE
jgi:hypothetical protein